MGDGQVRPQFWELPIEKLNDKEWELLCDRCGRCCLKKQTVEDIREIVWTRIICRYYEPETGLCGCYSERSKKVPDCIDVRKLTSEDTHWMPATCAYRRRFEGQPLPKWHPLLTGGELAVVAAGITVRDKVLSEDFVHTQGYHEHIIRWTDA